MGFGKIKSKETDVKEVIDKKFSRINGFTGSVNQ
jgi:hypothetical protein